MKVRKVFHSRAITIEAWETLHEAATRMRSGGFSCLPVVSAGDLVGIITERDIVEAFAAGVDSHQASVFDYMTEDPKTVSPDDDCTVAATEMLWTGCRHLPVMEGSRLIGMVSARDLLPLATTSRIE